jgi:mannose-6-phosphate isomerase-like protein (cupin superfamily)
MKMKFTPLVAIFAMILLVTPLAFAEVSQERSQYINADGFTYVQWAQPTGNEPVTKRKIHDYGDSEHYWIRLYGAEQPHVNMKEDLAVFVIDGEAVLHYDRMSIVLRPGDILDIPAGKLHWAENKGPKPAEIYTIYTKVSEQPA